AVQYERVPLRGLRPTMKDQPESSRIRDRHVPRLTSRRDLLFRAGAGFGALALAAMLAEDGYAAPPHPPAKAKSVIWLFMEGGPSHLELFDPKPELQRLAGQPLPASFGPRPIT